MTNLPRRQEPVIRWSGRTIGISAACALAIQELQAGRPQAAVEIFDLVLAKAPDYAEAWNNRGVVLQTIGRPDEALTSYEKATTLKPGYANAHFNRGAILKKLGRYDDALVSYDRAIAANPGHVEAWNNRGVLLQESKQYDGALASYDKVITLKPDHAEAHNNRGVVLMSKGHMAEAEKMFLKASQLKPNFPDPWFNLANIRNQPNADNDNIAHIRAQLDRPGITPEAAEHLHFTLGKIYDDCCRYDEAFEHYRQANQMRNARVAYDPVRVSKTTDEIIEVFSKDFMVQPFAGASDSRAPLFIVGMPRSGTTLLANMLSNHPAVGAAGELPTIPEFASHLGELTAGGVPYPAAARHLTADVAAQLTAGYEKRLRRDVGLDRTYVVDKNPLNFTHLGFISRLFPRARILHCTRHPLDTCLSNYFQRFPLHLDYCFDLQNIAHFYGEYARLMKHWRTIPTLNLIEIRYEDMILQTEQTARTALDFLGLDWDARCVAPHTNPGVVETASQWQVRQPIYDRALERWRHYEKHLGPLMAILDEPSI